MGCCRGFNARLLFLMGCAMIEYISHTVVLVLAPMIAMTFYPDTAFPRIGFYTALLSGAGYLGHVLSCRLWINVARALRSSKGVVLWGLAVIGAGYFSLLLCQSLLAMTIVRFATGLFSGVVPVALIEIDTICGHRQSHLASTTKYVGVGIGATATFALVALGHKLAQSEQLSTTATDTDSVLFFYPLSFVSVLAWIAVVVTLIGLRVQSRATYMQLAADDSDTPRAAVTTTASSFGARHRSNSNSSSSSGTAIDDSPIAAASTTARPPLERVKHAFDETFRLSSLRLSTNSPSTASKRLLAAPRPHFRRIRAIVPHFYHGFTPDGHVVVYDFVGQIQLDKLHASGFTTSDVRDHYRYFISFGIDRLLKPQRKIVYVIDLDGLTLTDADDRVVALAQAIVSDVQAAFPDKLHAVAVLNTPVWFSQVLKALRPSIVAKKTWDKVAFVRTETAAHDLRALIGVDSLPTRYGGRNGVAIGKSSQERALEELLKKTTGSLDDTIEMVNRQSQSRFARSRIGSSGGGGYARATDDGSDDDEAFFDSLEYGLQTDDAFDDDCDDISIVVHSQAANNATSDAVARPTITAAAAAAAAAPLRPAPLPSREKTKAAGVTLEYYANSTAAADADVAITREPHAVLILTFFCLWLLVQLSFDELFPLWVFRDNDNDAPHPAGGIAAVPHRLQARVAAHTLTLAGTTALMALGVLLAQLLFATLSSNVMTPLATLRVGLLFQLPLIGAFPLLDIFHVSDLSFAWAIVVAVLVGKHLMGAIAMHGLLCLLDNSIAIDRRLAVHRAAQMVTYGAALLSSAVAPALFALLGYFANPFPFNHSLLYFVQALGLVFLLLFSFAIPSRMNFPQLFVMGKR